MIVSRILFSLLKHFLWGANYRRFVSCRPADGFDSRSQCRIRDVRAVPCQQVVHVMDGSGRNVKGIRLCLGR